MISNYRGEATDVSQTLLSLLADKPLLSRRLMAKIMTSRSAIRGSVATDN